MIQSISGMWVDLDQLGAEFNRANIDFTSLGTDGTTIFTYDNMGNQLALDPASVPIIASHVPGKLQRDLVTLKLQTAVGQPILTLSDGQLSLLLVCLAYKAGALDPTTLALLPIESWI